MSRTRTYLVCLAALLGAATLPLCEWTCSLARAQQPAGQNQQSRPVRKPRPQTQPAAPTSEAKPVAVDANLLSMELKALRILRGFDATHGQLQVIARVAKTTAGKPGNREAAKASAQYVQTLGQMRRALIANDDDQIEKLRTQLDELEEKSPPDLDDEVEVTDGAEIEAVRLLNIFNPLQVVGYAQSLEDEFPDPVQMILEGLDEGRGLNKAEWETARNRIAGEVGWVICGTQGEKATKLEEQVSAFLDKKHTEEAAGGNREAEIRKLLGSPGPVVVLKNVMEHSLAELLSNPQVEKAVSDCLRPRTPRGNAAPAPAGKGAGTPARRPAPGPRTDAGRPRRSEASAATSTAKPVDLDDILKSPEDYEGQELTLQRVTVTGTAHGKLPANLWLAVKSSSGAVVPAGLRGQKLTFVLPKVNAPEAIKSMSEGDAISATLTCTLRNDPQTKHWTARVHTVQVLGN
ncbi:MAG TPA: hypothetical protein VFG04_26125 [Planctomycetaceae bacterium]|jgi:hypothetical protein|nr:hypothetical protein [Planctomycetaceae bacterium]